MIASAFSLAFSLMTLVYLAHHEMESDFIMITITTLQKQAGIVTALQ